MSSTPFDVCLYHGGCTDGFTAAWAVRARFGDAVEYIGCSHGEPPPQLTGKRILFVDFTYTADVLRAMASQNVSITVFDHHKTAEEDLKPLFAESIIDGIFDMQRSGAGIAWDGVWGKWMTRPKLIDYVEDRDLWRHALTDTHEISAYIASWPQTWDRWNQIAAELENAPSRVAAVREGAAILRRFDLDLESMRKDVQWMEIGGHSVPVVNANGVYASNLANMLARIAGAPFGATYYINRNGDAVYSLRSLPSTLDVGEIALRYGGGGHRESAGFTLRKGTIL